MHQSHAVAGITLDERRQAARFLAGDGIEIGACHLPVWVDRATCRVRYCDRLSSDQIVVAFPELGTDRHSHVDADVICDVAIDGLKPFHDNSQDFIIASHLVEHLPNPLAALTEFFRVLKPGGVLYLGLPDKNFTFDRDRQCTPLQHLIDDWKRGVTEVEEHHLVDWCIHSAKYPPPADPVQRKQLFDRELGRSIHVHVWAWPDMVEMVRYMVAEGGAPFELVEMYLPKGVKLEAIFMLRKVDLAADEAARRFEASFRLLLEREQANEAIIAATAQLQQQHAQLNDAFNRQHAQLNDALNRPIRTYLRGRAKRARNLLRRFRGSFGAARKKITAAMFGLGSKSRLHKID